MPLSALVPIHQASRHHRASLTGGPPAGSSWFCFILARPTPCLSELAAEHRSRTAQIFSCHRGPRNRKTYGAASPPEGDCWWPRRCTPSLAPALASPGSLRGSSSATTLPAPARNHARDQGRRLRLPTIWAARTRRNPLWTGAAPYIGNGRKPLGAGAIRRRLYCHGVDLTGPRHQRPA